MKDKKLVIVGIIILVIGVILMIPVPTGNIIFHFSGGDRTSAPLAQALALNYIGGGEGGAMFCCSPALIIIGITLLVGYAVRKHRYTQVVSWRKADHAKYS